MTILAATPASILTPQCVLDRDIMNKDTLMNMTDIGLSIFAPLCGKNRGAFVLDPPDGHTYGCIQFPAQFAELAGVDSDAIVDSNSIRLQYTAGNITGAQVVDLIDLYVKSVYASSADVDKDPFGCDVGGLGVLECPGQATFLLDIGEPIRAATLAGLFVPAPWATGGKVLTLKQASHFYTLSDFKDMKTLGLNAVQIPVPIIAFAANGDGLLKSALTTTLNQVEASGLYAIIVVVPDKADNHEAVTAAAAYCFENTIVVAMTLPSITPTIVSAARAAAPTLSLFLPVTPTELQTLSPLDDNVFAALQIDHSSSVADVASSGSTDDRMKMFYHEATACMARSPIEYANCYRHVPAFVSSGFDLSIDNCINVGSSDFVDYGQCGRFKETEDSGWWKRHRQSFAARQLFAYERGVGWSYSAWKLYDDVTDSINSPASLLALKDVAAAGLMPSLTDADSTQLACLNPPIADFALGDATLSPSAGPPPDCGNGWWNYGTKQCDYWIPPPDPTISPSISSAPTIGPCPVCIECLGSVVVSASTVNTQPSYQLLALSFGLGAVVALLLNAIVKKCRGGERGYETLP